MMNLNIDESRGYDVMRGKKVVEHFDSYAPAWEYARAHHLTLRYWSKPELAAESGADAK